MLDRAFLRPIAHRGLHDAARGIVENSMPAFEAAIATGVGIECDLQPAKDGLPIVFHDQELDRLVEGTGPVTRLAPDDLPSLRYRAGGGTGVPTFAALLDLVAGRVPILVEIKSDWSPPNVAFLAEIARLAAGYRGPVALMSFDPAVMARLRSLAPPVPRGIVAGPGFEDDGKAWWPAVGRRRAWRLANLLEAQGSDPAFYAYDVRSLPTLATRFARQVRGKPLFTWTVRTDADRRTAARYADAPIFEGPVP